MFEKLAAVIIGLREKRAWRISLQVIIAYVASIYTTSCIRWATESRSAYGTDEDLRNALVIVSWVGFAILYRTLVFDRIAFYAGLITGAIWLFFDDAVAMPFWAGSMALLVYFYRSRRDFRPIFIWYLLLEVLSALVCYSDQYSLTAHPLFLALFVVLLIACLAYEYAQKIAARKMAALQAMREEAELAKEEVAFSDEALDRRLSRLEKLTKLPEPVKKELTEIIASARQIRSCMQTDARDEEPGRQFLQRYLPIVEKIVTKGQELARQLEDAEKRQQSVTDQLNALASLNLAFRQQHQQLLQNDSDDLNLEIKALEKILKTDGYL